MDQTLVVAGNYYNLSTIKNGQKPQKQDIQIALIVRKCAKPTHVKTAKYHKLFADN